MQKVSGSPLLADVIREMGFRKATEFYIALGQGKVSTKAVANKLMQRLKAGEAVEETDPIGLSGHREDKARRTKDAANFGIRVKGAAGSVAVRLAKCCRPVPGDEIAGYVSLGRGITIHRKDCNNMEALKRAPERFVDVSWDGENESSYRVELQIDGGPWILAKIDRGEDTEFAWKIWYLDWDPVAPGEHTIVSRAIDASGNIQPAMEDPRIAKKHTYWESNGQVTRRIRTT